MNQKKSRLFELMLVANAFVLISLGVFVRIEIQNQEIRTIYSGETENAKVNIVKYHRGTTSLRYILYLTPLEGKKAIFETLASICARDQDGDGIFEDIAVIDLEDDFRTERKLRTKTREDLKESLNVQIEIHSAIDAVLNPAHRVHESPLKNR